MERSRESFVRDDEAFCKIPQHETVEELAKRVLFSDSLEEKLRPSQLSRESGSPSVLGSRLPENPIRPNHLRFARSGEARPSLPSSASLVNAENRGVLLHFFANHELLAAELMALALLKFPDAPPAFRAGLAETLREEQRHTRWYVNRMAKCGIDFGQYPLNRFFWDAVSSMESPLDYVSRLSLTFEQANLDYARHYAGVLDRAGDRESSAILDRIYHDEIFHVGYGLDWFRKWKAPDKSDWEELKKRLVFPISPSRAKGNRAIFNEDGRRLAGFDDDYIRRLSLFERSKGRTPNVYWFNPDTENRIARHPRPWHPTARIQSVVEDLEIVIAFLAKRDDIATLRRPPSLTHIEKLRRAGLTLPEFGTVKDLSDPEFRARKLHEFRPWGLGPDLTESFSFLSESSSVPQPGLIWTDSTRELFSKAAQSEALPEAFGTCFPVRSQTDLESAVASLEENGVREIQLKRPYSMAGGGMKRLTFGELKAFADGGMKEKAKEEGGLLLEPYHDRVFDFSVLFEMQPAGLRKLGQTSQVIAPSGGYRGTLSFSSFSSGLPPEIARFLNTDALYHYEEESAFCESLASWLRSHNYLGPVCVDAYLHRNDDGELQHRVACEINARFTMGRVAHELRKQVAPDCGLRFEILKYDSQFDESENYELKDGKIFRGSIILTEPRPDSRFAARITIAKRRDDL